MWLLKFHFAFSILCLITYFGVNLLCFSKETKQKYQNEIADGKQGSFIKRFIGQVKLIVACFVPFINIITVFATFIARTIPEWVVKKIKEKGNIDKTVAKIEIVDKSGMADSDIDHN